MFTIDNSLLRYSAYLADGRDSFFACSEIWAFDFINIIFLLIQS